MSKSWSWYLYAFCRIRKDFRFFKLSRMKNCQIQDRVYEDDYSDLIIDKKMYDEKTIKTTYYQCLIPFV